jgi:hypothetical protein
MTTATQNVSLELTETEKAEFKALADGDVAELMRAYEMFDTMEREAKAAMASIAARLGVRDAHKNDRASVDCP